jgi:carboxypeptidase Taq
MEERPAYQELIRRAREDALLASCAALLEWDEVTYMPVGGVEHRGRQMALLAGLQHARATDPRVGALLAELADAVAHDPQSDAAVNVRELRRIYDRLTRLPQALVEELARVTAPAQVEWAAARRDADFARFRPWLERVVALKREEAQALGYEDNPYDALLDDYEPGARTRDLAPLFRDLCRELVPLAQALTHEPRQPDATILRRDFPLERQRALCETALTAVGFDFCRGRLDTTAHPFFISLGPDDGRVTTHFHHHDFTQGLLTTLHEAGHALYEQGLDPRHQGTPLGEPASVGMHEAQARLWENAVGHGRPFWEYCFPLARRAFPEALGDVSLDAFYFALNRVEASPQRVRADEVTYNLHILIRFELEQALLTGDLPVVDLPGAWNEAYRHRLGVTPRDDGEGCLQDGHWSGGQFGYFPTYTLGNVYAAQLFARASADLGECSCRFAQGDFSELFGWLGEHVYRQGRRFPCARLVERVTGALPDPRALIAALRQKYVPLYGL